MPIQLDRLGLLGTSGQATCYTVGDAGDMAAGLARSYQVLSAGQYAGTSNLDSPHYLAATISFASVGNVVADTAAGLVGVKTGDTVRVRGSALNDGVYTVAVGGVAGQFTTVEALVDEASGAYVTILKREAHSNNCVLDTNTRLMWSRYVAASVGVASDGKLYWDNTAAQFTVHPAAGDLQMTTTGVKIVGGAGEVARYFAGMPILCSGFANAVNNLSGYVITAVTVNGLDLDLTLWKGNRTLIAEAAAGARTIKMMGSSIWGYAAAARQSALAGFNDWRIPSARPLISIATFETPSAVPDAVAFPGWPTADYIWSSVTRPNSATRTMNMIYNSGTFQTSNNKTTDVYFCALVRG